VLETSWFQSLLPGQLLCFICYSAYSDTVLGATLSLGRSVSLRCWHRAPEGRQGCCWPPLPRGRLLPHVQLGIRGTPGPLQSRLPPSLCWCVGSFLPRWRTLHVPVMNLTGFVPARISHPVQAPPSASTVSGGVARPRPRSVPPARPLMTSFRSFGPCVDSSGGGTASELPEAGLRAADGSPRAQRGRRVATRCAARLPRPHFVSLSVRIVARQRGKRC